VERPTPLSALEVAAGAARVSEPGFVNGRLHWIGSPPDGSAGAILCSESPGSPPQRRSPTTIALRSRLYGYGAAAWCATASGIVGIESEAQQLGVVDADTFMPFGAGPGPDGALGDPCSVPATPWVLAVAETGGMHGAWRGLIAVDVTDGTEVRLVEVAGRCGEPQVAPDRSRVAWLEWPDGAMPWDAAEIRVAALALAHGSIACGPARRVDGGRGASSGLPTWRPDGSLAYVTEAAGHWQPWVCDDGGVVRRLSARRAEFQRPRWLTCRWLASLGDDGALACAFADAAGEHVGVLHDDGALEVLDQPCVRVDGVAADGDRMGWVGATATAQGAVCSASAPGGTGGPWRWVVEPPRPRGPSSAQPEPFCFVAGGVSLAGVLWRPLPAVPRTEHDGPTPLVVTVHPGPTGAVDRSYAPIVHLLTAHGIAVCAIDVSGSTAHGRAHRERLLGRFGDLDTAECTAAARHLVDTGIADREALFIRGTSAGGTIALLALEGGTFRGAVAWYPASSLEDDDSGFEAGYLGALLGPSRAPRSPLARAAHLDGSVLVVQGQDDPIVTPAETAALLESLLGAGVDVELVSVPGEGHGFRTTAGRATALGAELAFYLRHAPRRSGPTSVRGAGERVADSAAPPRYDAPTGARPSPGAPPPP
jgi:dipeptidyl aminopeptidase/acylaminoacyl peptidase